MSCETLEDIIAFLGTELNKQGRTEEGIIASVMEREKAASTSYGNFVAIPHP